MLLDVTISHFPLHYAFSLTFRCLSSVSARWLDKKPLSGLATITVAAVSESVLDELGYDGGHGGSVAASQTTSARTREHPAAAARSVTQPSKRRESSENVPCVCCLLFFSFSLPLSERVFV